uniref:NADH-ubiquinone oxidoreductase chain 4L n=1 Tax=Sphenodon punctatus TaxID=8508 RepID=A0A0F7LDV2_SPHPU|nr:NADH dehydrogenase subunit 4L [Sphenodon punctatus]AKH60257.1 NADH dehydrogenase subunit 4L [Sphenodon punctatus]AKH60269.1 NADH dehydrogenase subunit 4L [Sphenodon punctatus]AKH60281.1 NADH dehydrogenase subunit 4L [Sphenodon punctatus]AKH60305.1 NADH dehydrogenase subunit 4L [Sphenodon punctatus]
MPTILFNLGLAFMTSMMGLSLQRSHLISALLCLEGMMLTLFLMLTTWATEQQSTLLFSALMMLLTLSACGAGTGLSLLVTTTRTHGSSNMNNLNLLQC